MTVPGLGVNVPVTVPFPVEGRGIGVALAGRAEKPDGSWGPWLTTSQDLPNAYGWKLGQSLNVQFALALVRTQGPVKQGAFDIPDLGQAALGNYLGYFDSITSITNPGGVHISITSPTCQIQTKSVQVSMGNDISMSTFKGKGSKSKSVPFKVSMTCAAGIPKLSYEMNPAGGASALDADHGILSLSNQKGASGFGVQVMDYQNNPLPLQQEHVITQYDPNKGEQNIDLGFNAAYIQTDSKVKSGDADAQATLTLSYQ